VEPQAPLNRYPTIDLYVDNTPLIDPAQTRQLLEDNGFVVAEAAGFSHGGSRYGVEGIQLGNSPVADRYNKSDVLLLCEHGLVSNLRAIRGVPGGISFVRTDGRSPYRAYFVTGDTVVHLNICSCVGVDDLQALAERWARAIEAGSASK
jgi:hypothetical protein